MIVDVVSEIDIVLLKGLSLNMSQCHARNDRDNRTGNPAFSLEYKCNRKAEGRGKVNNPVHILRSIFQTSSYIANTFKISANILKVHEIYAIKKYF